eukprot:2129380-Rhodomonas_salina.2
MGCGASDMQEAWTRTRVQDGLLRRGSLRMRRWHWPCMSAEPGRRGRRAWSGAAPDAADVRKGLCILQRPHLGGA